MSNQLKQVGFPCWFLLIEALLCLLRVVISFLSFSFLFFPFQVFPNPFLSVGSPKDNMIRKGSGGETEGDTVAPFSSLEERGWVASFRLLLLIGVSGGRLSYGVVNPRRREVTSWPSVLLSLPLSLRCVRLPSFCSTS